MPTDEEIQKRADALAALANHQNEILKRTEEGAAIEAMAIDAKAAEMRAVVHDDENLSAHLTEASKSEPILKFFSYAHLRDPLRAVSREFARLALMTIMPLPRSAERTVALRKLLESTVALRKLLESKDAAVRAALP